MAPWRRVEEGGRSRRRMAAKAGAENTTQVDADIYIS